MRAIYDRPSAHIGPQGGKLKTFPATSGRKQGWPLSPPSIAVTLEDVPSAVRQEKDIKGIQTGNKAINLSLVADDMALRNQRTPAETSLHTNSTFQTDLELSYTLIMKNYKTK